MGQRLRLLGLFCKGYVNAECPTREKGPIHPRKKISPSVSMVKARNEEHSTQHTIDEI